MPTRVDRRARRAIKTKKQADPKLLLRHQTDLIELRNKLRQARKAYFNSGKSIMSDLEYDRLENKLRTISPNDRLLQQVGAPVGKTGRKKSLPYPMPSLDKVKPDDTLQKWLRSNPGPYDVSDKLDGVSAMITLEDGEYRMYTRGNGATGTDISHLLPYIKPKFKALPKGIKAIRGELGLLRSTFNRKYAKKYENARNLTSGIVNSKDINPLAVDLVFFVHSVVMPRKALSTQTTQLKAAGFIVAPVKRFNKLSEIDLMDYLKRRREMSKLDIDGLVLTSKNSSIAFKSNDEMAIVEVDKVVWKTSRYGYLKPAVLLKKSVKLAGANISKLTAHNALFLVENKIGPGAMIEITRSGDVIPKILRTIKPSTRNLLPPGLDTKFRWNSTGVDLVTIGDTNQLEQQTHELVIFLISIDVDKVKEKLVRKLVEHGIDNIPELLASDVEDFVDAGIGHAAANHLHGRMRERMKKVELPALMAGSNKFSRGFGERKIEAILNEVPFREQLLLYKQSRRKMLERLAIIPGIGTTTATVYIEGFPRFVKFLQQIGWKPTKRVQKTVRKSGLGLNPIVVFTGFRDKELVEEIKAVGGKYSTSISRNTTHVVTLTRGSGGKVKLNKAASVGAKIIDLNTFRRLLGKRS